MYSIDYLYQIFGGFENFLYFCAPKRRGARVVEEARLESVYTPKGYPGFESPSLRNKGCKSSNYEIYTLFYTQKLKRVVSLKSVRLHRHYTLFE